MLKGNNGNADVDEEVKNVNEEVVAETSETQSEAETCGCGSNEEGKETCACHSEETGENSGTDVESLNKTIEERDELIVAMKDQLQRQMAEFDNFRKRTDKEKSDMFGVGASSIIKKLLPIVDNFERGFAMIPEGEEKTQFAVGMDMVYKQFMKMLEEVNVKPIEALGKEFDPNLHNAVQHIEKEGVGENIIVEEYEKGYMYGDTVLRHSMVIVAN
ncbi:MAG: nucleotide exchange factor GrpE [Clostridiales bacterium]|nr:nucleotide exchange factor GrpE [Clostridiales bacterium]MDU7187193.1 nucleotide exchange factor GrpE [Klebsiella sp.]MBS5877182.1 nucleotide exchange factor GrpE [Clostridiales bacterium]MDU0938977.1 nucleotide exchange factor GrpE [Clostridiales bacterium]MDU1041888.1 nucleotide exchange factor GrpE [Clostridiales bacterium]